MTTTDLLAHICAASDKNVSKVAVFHPSLTRAARRKDGATTLTFQIVTSEFTPDDVLNGTWMALAICGVRQYEAFMKTGEWLTSIDDANARTAAPTDDGCDGSDSCVCRECTRVRAEG